MELTDVRAFALVAETSSVSAAARVLAMQKSTVSRSLRRLEADVGATLVERSTRHLRLTDAGRLFHPYALRILADVDEAGTALDSFAGVPRGTLRISAPVTFAITLISPMLPSFIASFPAVRIVLDVDNRVIDMPVEDADLVIRVGSLADSDLIARHLMASETWTCASPAYLARQGTPESVDDLERHTIVAYADRKAIWSYRTAAGSMKQIDIVPDHVVSDSAALEPMLVGGAGIGRLPDFLARAAVGRGDLIRLFPETRGDVIQVHALFTSHRSLSAKVRVFIDALKEHLAIAAG